MLHNIYIIILNNRTKKFVRLECKIEFIDKPISPVSFIVDKDILKEVIVKSEKIFVRKLLKDGKYTQSIRSRKGLFEDCIVDRLKKEFGKHYTIAPLTIKSYSSVPKKVAPPIKQKAIRKSALPKKTNTNNIDKKIMEDLENKIYRSTISFGKIQNKLQLNDLDNSDTDKPQNSIKKEINYNTVDVLFATDRNKTTSTDPNKKFGNKRNTSNDLELGECKVSIPLDHKMGIIERPSWFKRALFKNAENPEKHVSIYDLSIAKKQDFINSLTSKIGSSSNKDAFIFIHGFNVSFAEAIRRTAQIAFDLSFKGAVIAYSWASRSKTIGYMSDEDSVVWTVPHLKQVIKEVLKNSSLEKLHLIGHSMGNRALTNAIKGLKEEGFNLNKINQIVLAAPDIDSEIFTDIIAPSIKGISKQITLYASSKDKALKLSKSFRSDILRAGESGNNIVIINGVDTVDASKVDTDLLGHGYFAETKELINDMYLLLEHSFTPPQRNLRQSPILSKGFYWLFPY